MDSNGYQEVLEKALPFIASGKATRRQKVFMQDNAPPHVSRSTTKWLVDHSVNVLSGWPPNSPDLNVVENCWALILTQMKGLVYRSEEELWDGIRKAWAKINPQSVSHLFGSLPDRITAVASAMGGHTRY